MYRLFVLLLVFAVSLLLALGFPPLLLSSTLACIFGIGISLHNEAGYNLARWTCRRLQISWCLRTRDTCASGTLSSSMSGDGERQILERTCDRENQGLGMPTETPRSTFLSIRLLYAEFNRILRQHLLNMLTLKQRFKPFLPSLSRIQVVSRRD